MSITLIIIIVTVAISFLAMNNNMLMDKLIFHPYSIAHDPGQWYRAFTCGLIHADIPHLAFNMISFYMFGDIVEKYFELIFGQTSTYFYLLLYISSLAVCTVPTYFKNKKKYNYYSLGASGAVSAVVFAGIFLQPTMQIGFFIIPPIIPGFVFAPIYLGLTVYLSKNGHGSINHSAHLWGAIYGLVFLIVAAKIAGIQEQNDIIGSFLFQVKSYLGNKLP